ncbi:MAG: right-handed parallel beta-helix repeat-containing protein [Verrucomicrobiales bacterium]|nr:right-handed parallel beta-helix repeat-containing protein [Verrucomicrobiales bacterium]
MKATKAAKAAILYIWISILIFTLHLAPVAISNDSIPRLVYDNFTNLELWTHVAGQQPALTDIDPNVSHAPYLKARNSLLSYELPFPLQQSFELKAKVQHTQLQRFLWIGFLDQMGKTGYSAHWDSSYPDGDGFVNVRKHNHQEELSNWIFSQNGTIISSNAYGVPNLSSSSFSELSLKWSKSTGTLTLSVNGKVMTQVIDTTFNSFSRIYIKTNGSCHIDDVTLSTGMESENVTMNHLFDQGSLNLGLIMGQSNLDTSCWKNLSGNVKERQDGDNRVVAFTGNRSRVQTPLPEQGTPQDYPLVTINYDIRRTSSGGNGGCVFIVNEQGEGIGFRTELAADDHNRTPLHLVSTSNSGQTHRSIKHKTWSGITGTNFHSISFTWNRITQEVTAMIDRGDAKIIGSLDSSDINDYSHLIMANSFSNTIRMDNLSLIRIPSNTKNISDYGAIPDGASTNPTDNHFAFVAAVAAAKNDGAAVYVPSGVFAYGNVITLEGVKMIGNGPSSILQSLNPGKSAIRLTGNFPALVGCQIQGSATTRSGQPHTTGVWVFNAQNYTVSANRISDIGSAGVFSHTSQQGAIIGNIVSRTLADGIHITGGSNNIQVIGNSLFNTEDDQIAVVSYRGNNSLCHDIEAIHNYAYGQTHGRGLTVVGGSRVTYARNQTSRAHQAGIYVNAETSYNTWAWEDIIITENVIRNAGMSHIDGIPGNSTYQGGIFISANSESPSQRITANLNQIYESHYRGIAIGNSCSEIVIDDNRIDGTAAAALHLTSPMNVILSNNIILNAGKYGLYTDNGISGYLEVSNNIFEDINTNNSASYIDVILISPNETLQSLSITGNDYTNPGGYIIERLIENHFTASLSTIEGNTPIDARIWQAR